VTDPELVAKKLALIEVHVDQDVDLAIVEDVVRNHLDDLIAFVGAMRRV
jgi:hypothetical protein